MQISAPLLKSPLFIEDAQKYKEHIVWLLFQNSYFYLPLPWKALTDIIIVQIADWLFTF